MKGKSDYAQQLQIEIGISFYHGYTVAKCEGFADSLGISAAEFTRRLGALLTPAAEIRQPLGLPDSLQVLRGETGARRQSLEPLALDDGSRHGARRPGALPGGAGQKDSPHKAVTTKAAKIGAAHRALWGALTPMQRAQKALDRLLAIKHKTPANQKAIATLRVKLATGESNGPIDKQQIYLARHRAKAAGRPIPPLPGKVPDESKEDRRRRLDRENKQRQRDAAKQLLARSKMAKAAKSGWGGMTKAQRSAEMKRRMDLARSKKSAPTYVNAGVAQSAASA